MAGSGDAPAHGARFRFDLVEASGSTAIYRVLVTASSARATAQARVSAPMVNARVQVGPYEGAIEPWAARTVVAFLEVLARSFDEETGWPRRIERWRKERD